MVVVGGIDEAGYGPVLGPLVVTGTAFAVPDTSAGQSLWELLAGSITRRVSRRDYRLPILDSKKLFVRKDGLAALERTALVMLRTMGRSPETFRGLLTDLCPGSWEAGQRYPWYSGHDCPLPCSAVADDVGVRVSAVVRDLASADARLLFAGCEPLLEGQFNQLIASTGNKASVLMSRTFRVMNRMIQAAEDRALYITIDRQGGRAHYRPSLMLSFEGYDLHILSESEQSSVYRLTPGKGLSGRGPVVVDFRTEAESSSLPAALASIISKYVRELYMQALNAFWRRHVPGLVATAGYYEDGHRFLRDIGSALASSRFDRALLIRSR